jgi:hypothetical protein
MHIAALESVANSLMSDPWFGGYPAAESGVRSQAQCRHPI